MAALRQARGAGPRLPLGRALARLGDLRATLGDGQRARAAYELAEQILANSPQAMALSKQAVWGAMERGYSEALESAWGLLRLHWGHPDFEEGPRAFAEKRDPRWNPDPNARAGDASKDEGGD